MIRITSLTGAKCAVDSGGVLKLNVFKVEAPQPGDIIINAKHTAVYRDGELINIDSHPFDYTPTGSSIDYTHRPIVDLEDGTIHTGDRLAIVLFAAEVVEFLDLADLDINSTEVTFIDMIDAGVAFDSHPASIVWDHFGNLLVGFFGNNYSVIGTPATDRTARVRKSAGNITATNEPDGPYARLNNTFDVEIENSGSDYIELPATSGRCSTRRPASGSCGSTRSRTCSCPTSDRCRLEVGVTLPGLRGPRLLPPGNGSGGLLVANGINVKRLDASGAIIQTYTPDDPHLADLDKIELSRDGSGYLWATDQLETTLVKFDLDTGAQLASYPLDLPLGQLCGFSNNGGYRAAVSKVIATIPPNTTTMRECTPAQKKLAAAGGGQGRGAGPMPFQQALIGQQTACGGGGVVPVQPDIVYDEDWPQQ